MNDYSYVYMLIYSCIYIHVIKYLCMNIYSMFWIFILCFTWNILEFLTIFLSCFTWNNIVKYLTISTHLYWLLTISTHLIRVLTVSTARLRVLTTISTQWQWVLTMHDCIQVYDKIVYKYTCIFLCILTIFLCFFVGIPQKRTPY